MLTRRHLTVGGLATIGATALGVGEGAGQSFLGMDGVFFDKDAPVLGNPKGKLTIVEYFDYQCPYCKSSFPMVKKVVNEDGDIRLVLKDWPIFGGASVFAAQAVLGAAQIGKYQIAVEALMKTKAKLSEEDVRKTLSSVGLTMDAIAAAVNKHNDKISGLLDRNYNQAMAFNLVGTPAYIIGKTIYPGVLDEKGLKQAIKVARS